MPATSAGMTIPSKHITFKRFYLLPAFIGSLTASYVANSTL
jgi:hypothetical protein